MASNNLDRQQRLYWTKMVELRVGGEYIRRYRDYLGGWLTKMGAVRAIASSAGIGAWAIWREYAFIWGAIIALSQVMDALKEVFPFTRQHKAASELAIVLESLFIDAQLEWESIKAGKYDEEQVSRRLHKLRTLHHHAECNIFRDGLPRRQDLFIAAEMESGVFFLKTYGVELLQEGTNHGGEEDGVGADER